MKKQVLVFLKFLLVPAALGVVLAVVTISKVSSLVLFWTFLVHFLGFFVLFVIRGFRHVHENLFKATFSVFVGAAITFVTVLTAWRISPPVGVEPWVYALYLSMMVISVVALFGYSVALKALKMSKDFDEKFMKKEE